MIQIPTFRFERKFLTQGFQMIAGVDEVGCGAWAGPVYAAAVILPLHSRIKLIRDSKLLSQKQRESVYAILTKKSIWAIGIASVEEVDTLNIRQASFLATRRAVISLTKEPDAVLSDGFVIPHLTMKNERVIGGDKKVKSIAAASIMAKVSRDRFMRDIHRQFPQYGFDTNVGYGTKKHQLALARYGICKHHRKSYKPIKSLTGVCE